MYYCSQAAVQPQDSHSLNIIVYKRSWDQILVLLRASVVSIWAAVPLNPQGMGTFCPRKSALVLTCLIVRKESMYTFRARAVPSFQAPIQALIHLFGNSLGAQELRCLSSMQTVLAIKDAGPHALSVLLHEAAGVGQADAADQGCHQHTWGHGGPHFGLAPLPAA